MPKNHATRPSAHPLAPTVALLRWPAHDDERRWLAALGRPRILLTDPDVAPPSLLDERELWLRDGCDAAVVIDAMDRLSREASEAAGRPLLDEDGLLRYAGHWVDVSPSQVGVVELLVRNYNRLVPNEDVCSAYRRAGRRISSGSIRALVNRLDARVALVGLRVHSVRRRGVMLTARGPTEPPGDRSAGG